MNQNLYSRRYMYMYYVTKAQTLGIPVLDEAGLYKLIEDNGQ